MSDLISREKAFDVLSEYYHHRLDFQHLALRIALSRVPSAEPERKTGRWIHIRTEPDGNALYECSECHKGEIHVPIVEVHYCWNCGARMDGGSE